MTFFQELQRETQGAGLQFLVKYGNSEIYEKLQTTLGKRDEK